MIAFDKFLHFISGFLIYITIHVAGIYFNVAISALNIMIVVFFAGIMKEIIDMLTCGDVEITDIMATVSGGFSGLLLFLAIKDG